MSVCLCVCHLSPIDSTFPLSVLSKSLMVERIVGECKMFLIYYLETTTNWGAERKETKSWAYFSFLLTRTWPKGSKEIIDSFWKCLLFFRVKITKGKRLLFSAGAGDNTGVIYYRFSTCRTRLSQWAIRNLPHLL